MGYSRRPDDFEYHAPSDLCPSGCDLLPGRRAPGAASAFKNQEGSCRAYAAAKGYDVQAVFHERAGSQNSVAQRPQLQALMNYLEAHQNKAVVVITVDPARLSRDAVSLVRLQASIGKLGATIEHPGHPSSAVATDDVGNMMLHLFEMMKRDFRGRRRKAEKE